MTTYANALGAGGVNGILAALASGYLQDGVTPVATTQRVNAGFMAPGQTAKQYSGKQALSTSVATTITLETVTTGKTYYMTDILFYADSASGTVIDVRLQAAGVDVLRSGTHSLAPINMSGIETPPFASAGQLVTILLPIVGTATNLWFNVYGFEQ